MSKQTPFTAVTDVELTAVAGGALAAGDGYCGTPYPWNPHAVTANVANIVSVPPVAIVSHY